MTDPQGHRVELARVARRELIGAAPPDALGRWSWHAFVACALTAIGLGVSVLYAAGTPMLAVDVTRELEGVRGRSTNARVGPYHLEPAMNALRFVLNSSHSPLGSARRRYVLAVEDRAGKVYWRTDGRLGGREASAKIVLTRAKLEPFEVPKAGEYFVRVRGSGASMDDLRAATLELRRGVSRVDPRLPWAFALAAAVCLVVNLFAVIRRPRMAAKADAAPDRRAA